MPPRIARQTRSGRGGHVDVGDAERGERVEHGVDDGRRRGDRARLADALRAERVVRARRGRAVDLERRAAPRPTGRGS